MTDRLPPRHFRFLGSAAPLAAFPEGRARVLGDWDHIGRTVGRLARSWDDTHQAALLRAVKTKRERWEQRVEVALDGDPKDVPLGVFELNVYEQALGYHESFETGVRMEVRSGVRLDWSQLDRLDGLYDIRYRGTDPGFGDYLRRRRFVREAVWLDHGRPRIDLGTTAVKRFRVHVSTDALDLSLPDTADGLYLDTQPDPGPVSISHSRRCDGLRLSLRGSSIPVITGADAVRRVSISGLDHLDLDVLRQFPNLEELAVWGKGGTLSDLDTLAGLSALRIIRFYQFFTFDPDAFPLPETWPQFDTVEFHGLTKENADRLRQRLRKVYRLRISGARSQAWVDRYADNPFRDWIDRDRRIAERACRAFSTAEQDIAEMGSTPSPDAVDTTLIRFIQVFNRIAGTGFIETVEREQIAEVFQRLAQSTFTSDEADTRFDQWRAF
ncbi:MAG TPA: hypothetical protein VJA46_13515 [Acidimicrobiia bacterium]|nr:hypothetical protein [Acidimicrobiia bacterium]